MNQIKLLISTEIGVIKNNRGTIPMVGHHELESCWPKNTAEGPKVCKEEESLFHKKGRKHSSGHFVCLRSITNST